jgi:ADP-ribosyl-[dinitrogen reductase] hydrolase
LLLWLLVFVGGADHHGMRAGENTLDGLIGRLWVRHLVEHGGDLAPEAFVASYIAYMTTPGSHNDTYAGT